MPIKTRIRRYFKRLLILSLAQVFKAMNWAKRKLIRFLLRTRAKLQIGSLRAAIHDADKDKSITGRKNMVVFNTTTGQYEPYQKKLLKNAAKAGKNTSNKAHTEGRKKMMKKPKKRLFDAEKVKQLENKSLYVTG